ncbi:MAG TPA: hypothetical protein VG603_01685 [Chitinophagales bacterium]|nr:hypothetical protein [Chitinophagales bacterium]
MNAETKALSYKEFLAFLMVYVAEMNYSLSAAELGFIKDNTGIPDIEKIKFRVDNISDAEAIDLINEYKAQYLPDEASRAAARNHLEEMLKAPGMHSQLETVVAHMVEKFI